METSANTIKRRCVTAGEYDVLYWRPVLGYLTKPGVISKIKRQMRRRERREGKREVSNLWS